jgi:hypothetical protein
MVWLEYPELWTDFFVQLFRLVDDVGGNAALGDVQHVLRVDMLMRVLLAIDCDIVSRRDGVSSADAQRIATIKDAMRAQCIERVIDFVYSVILAYTSSPQARGWRGVDAVVRQAVHVLTRYVAWVDIELVIGQGRAAVLTALLRVPEYRLEACAAVGQIVAKGMPAPEKLRLISNLRLKTVVLGVLADHGMTSGLPHSPLRKGRAEDEIAFLTSLGEIVNGMGVELCLSYDALRRVVLANADDGTAASQSQSAKEALDDLVQLLVQFLASPDIAVSASVFNFCGEYLGKLKRTPGELSAHRLEHLRAILHALCSQLRYPADYDHTRAPDEFEEQFNAYRSSMDTLVKNAAHMQPEFLADVINAMLVHVAPESSPRDIIAAQPHIDVECVVHLIFLSLEGARDDANTLAPLISQWLGRLMVYGVLRHPHRAVLHSFFDCCVRHSRLLGALQLPDGSSALMQVIEALLDERGMRAPGVDALSSELRQRASTAFARLARTQRASLMAYTDELLQVCAPLLTVDINSVQTFSFAAQLSLYEALGTLVGSSAQRAPVAATVVSTLLASIAALSANNALRAGTAAADIGSIVLAQHINAISAFCKSFQLVPRRRNSLTTSSMASSLGVLGDSDGGAATTIAGGEAGGEVERAMQEAYGALFLGAVDGVLAARVAAAHSDEVRSATNTFLHCMVDTLGVLLLSRLGAIIDASMAGATAHSLVEFTRLLCQLIDRFGERVRDLLEQLLLPLLEQLIAAVRVTLEQAAALDAPAATGGAGGGAGGGRTDASLEAGELRRAYFTLLSVIASKPTLADILRSGALQPALGGILSTLIDGLATDDDTSSQKAAATTMTNLVRRWIELVDAPSNPSMSTFGQFVWREAVPAGIALAVRVYATHSARLRASSAASAAAQIGTGASSVPLNAGAAHAVQEIAAVQQLLVQAHGTAALTAIGESAVALGCNAEIVTQYLTSLHDAVAAGTDHQTLRRLLLAFGETTAAQQQQQQR